jgi:transcriptional regulator with XRE-family HTH domain
MMERYQRMDPEHFNDVLDGIADALAMTDAEISQGSGISRQTINGMRGGRARIRPDKLWPLASALGADVDVFFLPDVAEAVREALRGRHYNRTERRFGPPNGPDDDVRGRSLSQKNGLLYLARQHNAWSYKLGASATAA